MRMRGIGAIAGVVVLVAGLCGVRSQRAMVPEPAWKEVVWLGSGIDTFPTRAKIERSVTVNRAGEAIAPWTLTEVPEGFAYIDGEEGTLHVCQRRRRSYFPLVSIGRYVAEVSDLEPAPEGLFLIMPNRVYEVDLRRRIWHPLAPEIVWASHDGNDRTFTVDRTGRILANRQEVTRIPEPDPTEFAIDEGGRVVARYQRYTWVYSERNWHRISISSEAGFDPVNGCFWKHDAGISGMFEAKCCWTMEGKQVALKDEPHHYPGFAMRGSTLSLAKVSRALPMSEAVPARIHLRRAEKVLDR